MKLFKVTVKHEDKWRKERRCFYAVSENKDSAKEYVKGYLKDGFYVACVSELGDQLAVYMYASKLKKSAF